MPPRPSWATSRSPGGGAAFGSSTVDVVVSSDDPDQLAELAQEVQTLVEGVDGTSEVTNNLAAAQPTVQVVVDRAAAAEVGLTETQVAGTVAAVMSPRPVGTVDLGDGPLDVTIEATAGPATLDELERSSCRRRPVWCRWRRWRASTRSTCPRRSRGSTASGRRPSP